MKPALVVLGLTIALSLHAQLSDQITVNVVEVPVNVTGFTGRTVRQLAKEDFELFVNGRPQPIEYFDVIDQRESHEAAPEAPRDLRRRRLFVLLFDPTNSNPFSIRRAREAAVKFVDTAPEGDTFAVAMRRHDRVEIVTAFTSDRVAVKRAIGTLKRSLARDAFNIATLKTERDSWTPRLIGTPDAGFGTISDVSGMTQSAWFHSSLLAQTGAALPQYESLDLERGSSERATERWVKELGLFADRLAPLEGLKHVVLITEGGGGGEIPWATGTMQQKFRKAGVVLDAFDTGGLRAPWGVTEQAGSNIFLLNLSPGTGGSVVSSFDNLREIQKVTYMLGFRPPENSKRWNRIRVRLRNWRFGWEVRYRSGYGIDSGEAKHADGLLLADVMLNDIPQNGMTVDLDIAREAGGATLAARVPGTEVLALGHDGATMMDVFFYVFDEHNVVAAWRHVRLRVDHEKGRDFLATHPYTIRQNFKLAPGKYSGKALLSVVDESVIGFGRARFDVE
jgi:VWFA-related protein